MAKAKLWPNGLGWDVGRAEVRNCGTYLRAFVPIMPESGVNLTTGKRFSMDRHKRMNFALDSDPVECVMKCRMEGKVCYDS